MVESSSRAIDRGRDQIVVDIDCAAETTRSLRAWPAQNSTSSPADVRRMFDAVARRYDVTNDVLSLGQDRRWRHEVIDGRRPEARASWCSTSPPAPVRRASRSPTAARRSCPCDFSLGMLQVGKQARPHLPFTAGDGTRLPFADDTFDAVTISFGLRNIVDPLAGPARDAPGDPARRAAGGLRVQPPDVRRRSGPSTWST